MDADLIAMVERMQAVSRYLGEHHPARGCIGCAICTCRSLLEGFGEEPVDDIILAVLDQ